MENNINWKNKTLEALEKEIWNEPTHGSQLELTCHQLRKKKLVKYEIEDLRIMINQQIGLDFLLPIALEELKVDLFAEGDFYPGDLLKAVLTIDKNYWELHPKLKLEFQQLIKNRKEELEEMKVNFSSFL